VSYLIGISAVTRSFVRIGAAIAIASMTGCVSLPEPASTPRSAELVAAPFARAWDAAIDQLADRGLAVRTVEPNAGFIATETITLPAFSSEPARWADCGTFAGFPFAPNAVDYTVFVRGDATGATIKASARYRVLQLTEEPPTDCVSTGAFERSFEGEVKQRAEAAR